MGEVILDAPTLYTDRLELSRLRASDAPALFASTDPQNHASHKLLRTLGFRQEAHFRQSLWFKGVWVDDVVFGLLRGEWV